MDAERKQRDWAHCAAWYVTPRAAHCCWVGEMCAGKVWSAGRAERSTFARGRILRRRFVGIRLCSWHVHSSLEKCIASVLTNETFGLKWCLWLFSCGWWQGMLQVFWDQSPLKWEQSLLGSRKLCPEWRQIKRVWLESTLEFLTGQLHFLSKVHPASSSLCPTAFPLSSSLSLVFSFLSSYCTRHLGNL